MTEDWCFSDALLPPLFEHKLGTVGLRCAWFLGFEVCMVVGQLEDWLLSMLQLTTCYTVFTTPISFFDLILSCCWIGAIILTVGFLIAGSGGQCLELQLGCLQSMQQAPALSSSSRLLSPTWALRISTEFCCFVCIYNCFWGMERNLFFLRLFANFCSSWAFDLTQPELCFSFSFQNSVKLYWILLPSTLDVFIKRTLGRHAFWFWLAFLYVVVSSLGCRNKI